MNRPDPPAEPSPPRTSGPPAVGEVWRYLRYGLSLPERVLRSGALVAAGTVKEAGALLLPVAFRNSNSYRNFVQMMLDFMAHDMGGMARPTEGQAAPAVENFVARKTVGNFLDLAGMLVLHASPLLVLAVFSDVAHGSQALLKELAGELRQQGVIAEDSVVDNVDQLLAAIGQTAGATADVFNTPPLSVQQLQQTVAAIRSRAGEVDLVKALPQAEVERMWAQMRELARQADVSLFALATGVGLYAAGKVAAVGQGAVAGVKVTASLIDRHVLEHYRAALAGIREQGYFAFLAGTAAPYLDAVWENFSPRRGTLTDDLLSGRLLGQAWGTVRRLLGGRQQQAPPPDPPPPMEP